MAYHPFRHLGLKILSIALAGAIWLTVGDQRAVERTMRVPLEYHNMPANLELMPSPPDTVEVRLRGPSGTIGRLLPGEVVAVLDLTAARPGTRLFHMLSDEVRVPYSVGVSQVNPAALPLTFEPAARRAVPVVPVVDGEPAPGYRIGRIVSSPEQVTVVGPTSHVVGVASATTEAGVGGQRHRQRGRSRRRRRRQRTGAARSAAERDGLGGDRPGRGGQAARSRAA